MLTTWYYCSDRILWSLFLKLFCTMLAVFVQQWKYSLLYHLPVKSCDLSGATLMRSHLTFLYNKYLQSWEIWWDSFAYNGARLADRTQNWTFALAKACHTDFIKTSENWGQFCKNGTTRLRKCSVMVRIRCRVPTARSKSTPDLTQLNVLNHNEMRFFPNLIKLHVTLQSLQSLTVF